MRTRLLSLTALLVIAPLLCSCAAAPAAQARPEPTGARRSAATTAPSRPLVGHLTWAHSQDDDPHLFRSNADGTAVTALNPGVVSEQPHFSPDGRLIAATALVGNVVTGSVMRADGTRRRVFAPPKDAPGLACTTWSPDAQRLTCEGFDDAHPGKDGVYTVRSSDGQDLQRITRHKDVPCSYSPDGHWIAFIRLTEPDEDASHLMVVRTNGSREHLVTATTVGLGCDWSPDGRTLPVASRGSLLTVALDGRTRAIPVSGRISGGSYSPDGTHIAFSRATGDHQEDVWTMAADGTEVHRVTATVGQDNDEEQIDWGR